MKHVKAKGVPEVVYEPTLDAPEFFGSEVTHDLEAFKAGCDVIVANRGATSSRTWRTRCTRGICSSGARGEGVAQVYRSLNKETKLSSGYIGWRRCTLHHFYSRKLLLLVAAVPSPMPFVPRCAREGVERALRNGTVSLSTIALSQMRHMSYHQSYRSSFVQPLPEGI